MEKVGIIGGGSIGLLLAAYLCKAGFDTTIYTRTKKQASEISNEGVVLQKDSVEEKYAVKSIPFSEVEQLYDDVVFVAVKQYHLKAVIESILKLNNKVNSIVFLQNGMGHVKLLDMLCLKAENIFIGIVEHGALKQTDYKVAHTGDGQLKIGCFQQRRQVSNCIWGKLKSVGFATSTHDDWQKVMERKLVVNGVINPLTAILKVRNGALVVNKCYFEMMRQLFEEIRQIFSCSEEDWQEIIKICQATSKNRSSMLKDIQEGRQTEIDAITGWILERAKELNVTMPYNQFVYNAVKGMELERKEERYE